MSFSLTHEKAVLIQPMKKPFPFNPYKKAIPIQAGLSNLYEKAVPIGYTVVGIGGTRVRWRADSRDSMWHRWTISSRVVHHLSSSNSSVDPIDPSIQLFRYLSIIYIIHSASSLAPI
jgi:hypothetical protein